MTRTISGAIANIESGSNELLEIKSLKAFAELLLLIASRNPANEQDGIASIHGAILLQPSTPRVSI